MRTPLNVYFPMAAGIDFCAVLKIKRSRASSLLHVQGQDLVFLALVAHRALQLAIRVALTLGMALVVFLLAFTQGNFALDQVLAPVKREADAGVTLC